MSEQNVVMPVSSALIPQDEFNVANVGSMAIPDSWDDALAILESATEISRADVELADEWPEIEKDELVNVELVLMYWTISTSELEELEYGNQYVVARGITRNGKRFRFTDGSTGVFRQLARVTYLRKQKPETAPFANTSLYCPHGLTRSEYTKMIDGKKSRAVTHYIAS